MRSGDHVHVAGLGKGVVREVRTGGRVLIEIKGRSFVVNASQLSPVDPPRQRPNATAPEAQPIAEALARPGGAAIIDLHGMTTDEAATAFDLFVNDAILAGLVEVRVIHGRSGGRLKAVVHGRLKGMSAVRGYRIDPGNPGVTIVHL